MKTMIYFAAGLLAGHLIAVLIAIAAVELADGAFTQDF